MYILFSILILTFTSFILFLLYIIKGLKEKYNELIDYVMYERNPQAYYTSRRPKKIDKERELKKQEEVETIAEWRKIIASGVVNDDQIKRFGIRDGVIG